MKKFLVLWSSQASSLLGSSVVGFALAWYLKQETHSATILSTAMLVNFVPIIILGPFLGPLVDRWNRKKIMIYGDLASLLLTLVLVLLFLTDTAQVWHIYLVIAGRAIGTTFQSSALSASVPMIVPEKQLVRANGLNRMQMGLFNLVGPPAGAFLMATLPVQWVLSVDIITAVIAILVLLPLKIPQPPRTTLSEKMNVLKDMSDGFRYVLSWKGMLYLIALCAVLNLFAAPLSSLLPLYVEDFLGNDVLKLGWLQTAFGAGIIGGGLLLSVWSGFGRRIFTTFTGFTLWCVAIILFGLSAGNGLYLGLAMWMIAGFGNSLLNTPVGAILQSKVDKDMQGRVFTMFGSASVILLPVGLGFAGPVADAIGIDMLYVLSGVVMLVLVIAGIFSRDVRKLEDWVPGKQIE